MLVEHRLTGRSADHKRRTEQLRSLAADVVVSRTARVVQGHVYPFYRFNPGSDAP